jgi:CheY-specific phosphatase CheX
MSYSRTCLCQTLVNSSTADGFIVDLTPPVLVNLGDGSVLHEDKTFQVGF